MDKVGSEGNMRKPLSLQNVDDCNHWTIQQSAVRESSQSTSRKLMMNSIPYCCVIDDKEKNCDVIFTESVLYSGERRQRSAATRP
jgi:hypothetical protein